MRLLRLALMCVVASSLAASASFAQSILCSGVSAVIGYGQYTCVLSMAFSVEVIFQPQYCYTQPTSTSGRECTTQPSISVGGTGYCRSPLLSDLMPPASSSTTLSGTGSNYNTYTQFWQGTWSNYGVVSGLPVLTGSQFTSRLSFAAKGCCS